MPVRTLLLSFLILTLCGVVFGNAHDDERARGLQPGVARELALQRSAHYSDVRYTLRVELVPGAELLKGTLKVEVKLDAEAGDLVLDWRVVKKDASPASRISGLSANGKAVADARFADDHIVIPRAYLVTGENVLQLSFMSPISASGSAVTRYLDREDNSEYIYTLFVPSDASTAFPCFDQPDLKARFTLSVEAPAQWAVVGNTRIDRRVVKEAKEGAIQLVEFSQTEPLSTYHFAFAAGPFTEFKDDASGYGTRLFVRRSKAERMRKELPEVFRLNRESLKFFEGYFDFKFPFSKYDLIIIPEFAYNGMEHAGATFLREESVIFPTDPTAGDLLARADVMFHEAAHQWFGDLVTMRWFDDLWLKEGFATFMGYKAIEALMPQYDAWKVFHLRNKPLAYLTDVTKGTTPIWQEIANLSAAKSAYGNIVYRKAPSMLRQAEFFLGPAEFQRAVRALVKERAYANAEWADLVRAFERASNRKLDAWADAWVKRRGLADVRVRWSSDKRGRIDRFTLEQRDVLGEGGAWPMRLKVLLASADGGQAETLSVLLDGAGATNVKEAVGKKRPAYVFANFEDYGYGRFLLDEESRMSAMKNLGAVREDFLRALLWGSLWESVREAELSPLDYIRLGIEHAARERDDVTLQFILTRVQTAFTRYLSDERKREIAPQLEQVIYEGMMNAATPGLRITYFRTYRDIATTREARDRIVKILAGDLNVPGMTLRSRDRFDLIRALTAAGDERAPALLQRRSAEDKTDDARRYAYAAAAAQADSSVKKKYFDAYLNDPALAESWIEASFGPFNTPQQSALTLPYLAPSLRELPNLKRTRKIFFVNGWLAAFIGGQCDARALGAVQDFLSSNPSLDRDLRLKVLEATDGLERCVRIRSKYDGARSGDEPRPAS